MTDKKDAASEWSLGANRVPPDCGLSKSRKQYDVGQVKLRESEQSEDRKQYDVGYGKPPESGQFKKGTSGNNSGRPKGRFKLTTLIAKSLKEKLPIRTADGTLKKQRIYLLIDSLFNNCLTKGRIGDYRLAFNLIEKAADDGSMNPPDYVPPRNEFDVLMDNLAKSMGLIKK